MIKELVIFALLWMLAVGIGLWLAKRDNERRWINCLADQSRARKAPGTRRRCRYVKAGYVYENVRK